ncbi:MAG: Secretion system C-terminal sorting domain, partial [Bacteroidota bacterium]
SIEYQITGGVPPYILQTFGPGGFWSNQTSLNALAPGLYNWVCVDANGCSISGQTEVLFITHVSELPESGTIRVFPNPASDYFNVQSECPLKHIELFSTNGKLLLSADFNSELLGTVRIDNLSSGFYVIETSTTCGKSRNYIVVE